jgi:hypothetical protein
MGICGIWFQTILSLVSAVQGGDWRTIYKSGVSECQAYIQDYI